jgi:hypothetical protein
MAVTGQRPRRGQGFHKCITESNRMQLVIFCMQNRSFSPQVSDHTKDFRFSVDGGVCIIIDQSIGLLCWSICYSTSESFRRRLLSSNASFISDTVSTTTSGSTFVMGDTGLQQIQRHRQHNDHRLHVRHRGIFNHDH